MSGNGVRSVDLPVVPVVDELIGHYEGSSARVAVDSLASQLATGGPVFNALDSLAGQITAGTVVVSTWPRLQALSDEDGAGAEVIDADQGTHPQATQSGYDGEVVSNAGRYSYNEAWGRWERIGDTGLAATASTAYVNEQVQNLEDAIAALSVSAGISYFETMQQGLAQTELEDFFYVGTDGALSLFRNDDGEAVLTIEHVSQTDLINLQASVEAIRDDFQTLFLGIKTVAPTTDNSGEPLIEGALYFDVTLKAMFIWDGVEWQSALEGLDSLNEDIRFLEGAIHKLLPNTEGAVKMRNLGMFDPGQIIGNLTENYAVPEVQDAANLIPFLGLMTEASIETGQNENGLFMKFPQGQMICRFLMSASTAGPETWTFPASFSDEPRVWAISVDAEEPRITGVGSATVDDVIFSAWKLDGSRGEPPVSLVAFGSWK